MWAYGTDSVVYCSILSSINCLSKSSKVNALEMKSSFWKCWTNQTVRVPSRLDTQWDKIRKIVPFREAALFASNANINIFLLKKFKRSNPEGACRAKKFLKICLF